MTNQEKKPQYNIEMKIGNEDMSPRVKSVIISNSIRSNCQNFIIEFEASEQELLQKNISGQDTVKLRIERLPMGGDADEQHDFNLTILKMDNDSKPYGQNEVQPPNKGKVTIVCAVKEAWECLTTPVNYFSKNTKKETPFEVAKNIADKFLKKCKNEIDRKGSNNFKPEQIVIPPMNFSKSLDYLDKKYGIYQGVTYYTSYTEDNEVKFNMFDLGQKIKDPPIFLLLVIPPGTPVPKEAYSVAGILDTFYYTFSPSVKKISGNVSSAYTGSSSVFISKDPDKLFEKVEMKSEDVFKKVLPKSKGKLLVDESSKKTKTFNSTDFSATSDNTSAITSSMAKKMFEQFGNNYKLEGVIKFKNLKKVGLPIQLIELSDEGKAISGSYLIKNSIISLKRNSSHFVGTATIGLIRSNLPDQNE